MNNLNKVKKIFLRVWLIYLRLKERMSLIGLQAVFFKHWLKALISSKIGKRKRGITSKRKS